MSRYRLEPTFRKAGRHEGFRIVHVTGTVIRRVSRRVGQVRIPKVGWVRFLSTKRAERLGRLQRRRSIPANAWTRLLTRLEHKAPGRIEKVNPRYISQRCATCGHVAAENRESQAVFRCTACGHRANADVNAVINIAAGRAVTARGALQPPGGAENREPQLVSSVD